MLDKLFTVEWADLFIPAHSVAEMVVRPSLSSYTESEEPSGSVA